ncbi:hypothetical protein [Chromobacterium sp. ASV23]|uniref:hypothetical protein n=1 Tax=Chromobacterium sp. ASV23 TaxID=2795110 RepID=UPI0018EB3F02|nr:hypothetical protein [Chromobacterium sp. ASV23]
MDKETIATIGITTLSAGSGITDSTGGLSRLLARRHPEYDRQKAHWKFLESCYEGGRGWFKDNVFRYVKEGEKEFEARLMRAYRFNHTREVVDLVNKYLFRKEVLRSKEVPDVLQKFWERATRKGESIDEFMRLVSLRTSTVGRVAVVIDSAARGGMVTAAEAKAAGSQIYAYIVQPQHVLDYSYDEFGVLRWVLIEEHVRDDEDPFGSNGEIRAQYRLWTRNSWTLVKTRKGAGKQLQPYTAGAGDHDLGVVPVVLVDHSAGGEKWHARSLIDDIAYLDRAVANYLSNLDAIIQDQTFSQLAMPAQGVLPGSDAYKQLVEMGTSRIFLYDGTDGAQPFYLSPDVKQAQLIVEVVNKIISEIYHCVGMAGERTKQDNAVGIDNSSGVAKAYDFERVNALLASKADALEVAETQIAQIVCLWGGEEIDLAHDAISYPDDFDTRGLADELDLAAKLQLISAPDIVRREQMGMLVEKLFPQLKSDLRKRMKVELNAWPVDPIQAAIEAAAGPTPPQKGKGDAQDKGLGKRPRDSRQGQVTSETPQ